MVNEIKSNIRFVEIKPGQSFEANGKVYTPSETFAIGRFERVEEMEEELIMLSEKKTCHAIMLHAMKKINEFNPGEAYTALFNKIESDQRNAKMMHFTLRLCTAYINYEGEDPRYLTDDLIKVKINDWSEAGLDIRPFVLFAVSVLKELLDRYKNPIASILTEAKEIKEAISEVLDIKTLTEPSGQETP
jgi:hypothetical protein